MSARRYLLSSKILIFTPIFLSYAIPSLQPFPPFCIPMFLWWAEGKISLVAENFKLEANGFGVGMESRIAFHGLDLSCDLPTFT